MTVLTSKTKIFISYSRQNRERIERLYTALSAEDDLRVFRDTDDILPTEEWKPRLEKLIRESDTIIFALSPHSVASDVCKWELDLAASLNKRIIPIVIENVDGVVPAVVSKLNYIFLTETDNLTAALSKINDAIRLDINWVREHTRLAELADRWEESVRLGAQPLRGKELEEAERWLGTHPDGAPNPTDNHRNYILRSRKLATKRQRVALVSALVAVVLISILGGWALTQRSIAIENEAVAETQRIEAETARDVALNTESRFLAASSESAFEVRQYSDSLALATLGLPNDLAAPERPLNIRTLRAAIQANMAYNQLDVWPIDDVKEVAFIPNSYRGIYITQISSGREVEDWRIRQFDLREENPVSTLPNTRNSRWDSVTASKDGRFVAALSYGRMMIWDAMTFQVVKEVEFDGIVDVQFTNTNIAYVLVQSAIYQIDLTNPQVTNIRIDGSATHFWGDDDKFIMFSLRSRTDSNHTIGIIDQNTQAIISFPEICDGKINSLIDPVIAGNRIATNCEIGAQVWEIQYDRSLLNIFDATSPSQDQESYLLDLSEDGLEAIVYGDIRVPTLSGASPEHNIAIYALDHSEVLQARSIERNRVSSLTGSTQFRLRANYGVVETAVIVATEAEGIAIWDRQTNTILSRVPEVEVPHYSQRTITEDRVLLTYDRMSGFRSWTTQPSLRKSVLPCRDPVWARSLVLCEDDEARRVIVPSTGETLGWLPADYGLGDTLIDNDNYALRVYDGRLTLDKVDPDRASIQTSATALRSQFERYYGHWIDYDQNEDRFTFAGYGDGRLSIQSLNAASNQEKGDLPNVTSAVLQGGVEIIAPNASRILHRGAYLVLKDEQYTISIWVPQDDRLLATFAVHDEDIIAFDTSDHQAVSADRDGIICIWSHVSHGDRSCLSSFQEQSITQVRIADTGDVLVTVAGEGIGALHTLSILSQVDGEGYSLEVSDYEMKPLGRRLIAWLPDNENILVSFGNSYGIFNTNLNELIFEENMSIYAVQSTTGEIFGIEYGHGLPRVAVHQFDFDSANFSAQIQSTTNHMNALSEDDKCGYNLINNC